MVDPVGSTIKGELPVPCRVAGSDVPSTRDPHPAGRRPPGRRRRPDPRRAARRRHRRGRLAHRDDRQPQRQRRSERHRDDLPLRVRHLRRLRPGDAGRRRRQRHRPGRRQGPDHRPDAQHDLPLPARGHQRPGRRRVGADRTFRTATGPRPAARQGDRLARGAVAQRAADHPASTPTRRRRPCASSTGARPATARTPPTIDAGTTDGYKPFSMAIDRLRPNTRYHFRAVATNAAGTTRSLDRSFVTTREPTGISLALAPSKVTWGQDLTVIGRVRGTAVGGTGVALERQSFPFQSGFSEVARKTAKGDGTFQFNVSVAVPDHALPRRHAHQDVGREPHVHGVERGQGPRRRPLARPPPGAHQGRDLAAGAERPGPAQEALAARELGRGQAREGEGVRRQPLALLLHGQAHPQAGALPRHRAPERRRRARGRALEAGAREEAAEEAQRVQQPAYAETPHRIEEGRRWPVVASRCSRSCSHCAPPGARAAASAASDHAAGARARAAAPDGRIRCASATGAQRAAPRSPRGPRSCRVTGGAVRACRSSRRPGVGRLPRRESTLRFSFDLSDGTAPAR